MTHHQLSTVEILWYMRYLRRQYAPRRLLRQWRQALSNWRRYWASYHRYAELDPKGSPPLDNLYPCLGDDTAATNIEPIYFYQDTWAFEHIVRQRPEFHVDVGSHHKFVALLSKVLPVTMVDIRPLSLPLDTLTFREGSILDLPYDDGSVPSVSSLCVVEHIGLGRYGDPLDPLGTEKSIEELKRIVQPGGYLYLSVPLDDVNQIYFNAHRAFTESYMLDMIHPFSVLQRRYIYGNRFSETQSAGFGTGCYQLRRPE